MIGWVSLTPNQPIMNRGIILGCCSGNIKCVTWGFMRARHHKVTHWHHEVVTGTPRVSKKEVPQEWVTLRPGLLTGWTLSTNQLESRTKSHTYSWGLLSWGSRSLNRVLLDRPQDSGPVTMTWCRKGPLTLSCTWYQLGKVTHDSVSVPFLTGTTCTW